MAWLAATLSTFAGINFSNVKTFLIQDNTISNVAANGIQIANSPDAEGTIVRNNEVTNADNKSYTFELDSNDKEINPQDDLAREAGITIWANSNNITVTGNTVTGSHDGIIVCNNTCGVSDNAPGDVNAGGNTIDSRLEDDVVVTRNKVTGNTGGDSDVYEIANFAASGVLNAQNNYYGGDSPGADKLVYGSVYYQPWYSDAALTTEQWNPPISVIPATFGNYFDTDSTSADYGKPLSGKITHGDTVQFAVGTYTTPIHIVGFRDLILRGLEDANGNRATFKVGGNNAISRTRNQGMGDPQEYEYFIAGVLADDSTNIVVDNFTFDLSGVSRTLAGGQRNAGVLYLDSSGTVSNNVLSGIGYPADDSMRELTIAAMTELGYTPSDRVAVTIAANTITDGGRVAIYVSGWVDATVSDNVVQETGDDFAYGVEFVAGAQGSITGNEISGYHALADEDVSRSSGIYYVSNFFTQNDLGPVVTNTTISGNTLRDNRISIYVGSRWCDTVDGTELDLVATIEDNQIYDSHYTGIEVTSCLASLDEDSEDIDLTITGNEFKDIGSDQDGDYGIHVANSGVGAPGNGSIALTATGNKFIGLTRGMWVDLAEAVQQPGEFGTLEVTRLDVSGNYWGSGFDSPSGTQLVIDNAVSLTSPADIETWYYDEALTAEVTSSGMNICRRTGVVQDATLASPDSDCAAVTESDLDGILTLNLSTKNITELKPGDFVGLSNMTKLDLGNNRLEALPAGVFDNLTALTRLNLDRNWLKTLPKQVFA